jgi:capsular exopolysaccharide synthesis family protein
MKDTFYSVLGIEPRASRDQVEKAYRFSLELYREDSLATSSVLEPTEAADHLIRVREAYEVLSDPERRRAYDEDQGFAPPDSPETQPAAPDFLAQPPQDTFYRVLGIEPRASRDQVEKAYRFSVELYEDGSLATSSVLDPEETAEQRLRVREAYEILSDPEKRRAYDESQGFPPPDWPDLASPAPDYAVAPAPELPGAFSPFPASRDNGATFSDEVPVTAEILEPKLASLLAPGAPAFEPFRVLRTKVRALGAERPFRCFGLVSATAQEGTSAVAVGLAGALAQERELRVLLLEARLRAPALERVLGLASAPGLSEWLAGSGSGPVPLRRVEPWGFHLLAGGAPTPQPAELLASDSMGRLLAAARSHFDFVLLDCPPLESVADSVVLQDLLDGLLLVVRARHASRDAIRQALSHLKPGAIRGVVFNDRTEILTRWLDRRRPRPAR